MVWRSVGVFLGIVLFSSSAEAAFRGTLEFSEQDRIQHKQSIHKLVETSAACLNRYKTEHLEFYRSHCYQSRGRSICLSKFYGDRRFSKKRGEVRSDGEPLQFLPDALEAAGFAREYVDKMTSTSCVGMTLLCLEEGFQATGQDEIWQAIRGYVRANGVDGSSLQEALRQLGWTVYYWNPSPMDNSTVARLTRWDAEESGWKSKGWHLSRYRQVMRDRRYYDNPVDNVTDLTGFGTTAPKLLERFPFWVGTAHTGYHVFPGTYLDVIEAHSTRALTSIDNLQFSKFSPLATGGGPRWTETEKYRSGLIALPPLP